MLTTTLTAPSILMSVSQCKCFGLKFHPQQAITLLNRLLLELCSWVTTDKDQVTIHKVLNAVSENMQ